MKRWGKGHKQMNKVTLLGWMAGLFLLLVIPSESQSNQDKDGLLDQQKWKELTKDVSYQPEDKPEKKERQAPVENEGVSFNEGTKYVLIVVVLLSIGFFVYKFLPGEWIGLKPKNKEKGYRTYNADPEGYEEIRDLPARLQEALNHSNYPLALRIYYLMIMKGLVKKGLIRWEKDKTNSEYLDEMKDHHQFDQFRKATRTFEKVWYGTLEVDYHQFKEYEAVFSEMAHNLNVQFNEE